MNVEKKHIIYEEYVDYNNSIKILFKIYRNVNTKSAYIAWCNGQQDWIIENWFEKIYNEFESKHFPYETNIVFTLKEYMSLYKNLISYLGNNLDGYFIYKAEEHNSDTHAMKIIIKLDNSSDAKKMMFMKLQDTIIFND